VPFDAASNPPVRASEVTTDGYQISRHNGAFDLAIQMPVPTVPTKTSRGHDELRTRTQRLGQRHRTVLFLVDGRRTLAEVLSLAHQAGAQTGHFEELVRLGLVELPAEHEAAEAIDSGSGALDAPTLTSVALDVPTPQALAPLAREPAAQAMWIAPEAAADIAPLTLDEPADTAPIDASRLSNTSMLPPQPVAPPSQHAAVDEPIALQPAQPLMRPPPEPEPAPEVQLVEAVAWSDTIPLSQEPREAVWSPPEPALAVASKSSRKSGARAAAGGMTAVLNKALGRGRARPPEELPPVMQPVVKPSSEQQLIAQVRELLIDTLRIDAPLFAALTHGKVRSAQTQRHLIELVWEIERHRSHARMSRDELISLQQARELLGMGNTLVAGDGQSDRHDDWPTTQPRL
jgi:hypothetical protein